MFVLIAIILIFGGIGSVFKSLIAGSIRVVIPGLPARSGHHHVKKGFLMILAGILLLIIGM